MKLRLIALSLTVLGLIFVFSCAANAQRGGGGFGHAPGGPGRVGPGRGPGFRGPGGRFRHPHGFNNAYWAYWPYYFYPDSDYDDDAGMVEGPAPPQQFIGPAPAPTASPAPAPKPADSVMLELRGNHWVRITNYGQTESGGQPIPEFGPNRSMLEPARQIQAPEPPPPLPAAVLVFRDGRQEEIGKYVIVGKTIRVSEDYWTTGSWSKTVQIADLDVPATLKLNQQRGTKFSLPSNPNEVMFRP